MLVCLSLLISALLRVYVRVCGRSVRECVVCKCICVYVCVFMREREREEARARTQASMPVQAYKSVQTCEACVGVGCL